MSHTVCADRAQLGYPMMLIWNGICHAERKYKPFLGWSRVLDFFQDSRIMVKRQLSPG